MNPGSVILSGEMMFRYLGWNEAADLIISSLERTIGQKRVTYDFERLMPGATLLKTSEFGEAMVENMEKSVKSESERSKRVDHPFHFSLFTFHAFLRLPFSLWISLRSFFVGRPLSGPKTACSDLSWIASASRFVRLASVSS